jgi:hypothetical protein
MMNKISPGQLRVWKNRKWIDFGRKFVVLKEAYIETNNDFECSQVNESFWFVYSSEEGYGPLSEVMILKDSKVLK